MSARSSLLRELRRNAKDEINRTYWDGAAASAYEHSLALVQSHLPLIENETLEGLRQWVKTPGEREWAPSYSEDFRKGYETAVIEVAMQLGLPEPR